MSKVVVFAGTTEGREICAFLGRYGISSLACTATEYGKCLIEESEQLRVRSGRLTEEEMAALFGEEKPELVIDATHPYAEAVSANLWAACKKAGTEYLRLLRPALETAESCVMVDTAEDAAAYLAEREGKALVTTGSKELAKFTAVPDYAQRIYARVLPTPSVMASCAELGFDAAHLIGMQGPFSLELNLAMLRSIGASFLVTKESGKNGGFEEKLEAARQAGAQTIVIGRPVKEEGRSEEEVKRILCERFGIAVRREIVIAGIGMGSPDQMTLEVDRVCREADILIGAGRMVEAARRYQKPCFASYRPLEIRDFVMEHPEYEKVVLLQSGDVGFYSGARKLKEVFGKDANVSVTFLPGISSVVALSARLGIPWEDTCLISLHGRDCNFVEAVRRHEKVFALAGDKDSIPNICRTFLRYGWNDLRITAASDLSYPEERIVTGTPEELLTGTYAPLAVVLIENPQVQRAVTAGIPDEEFLRDRVPMTKREVRNASLSHLALQPDSVVYDIGAGTGSVSVEMALQACEGKVYAIEKNPVAVELLRKNREKFAVDHLEIIEGTAPEALRDLPCPTHAFIGGSAGNLREILELLLTKNPKIRVVLNTVTLETLAEATTCLKELPFGEPEIVCIQAAGAKKAGRSHLMMGQNPVYIFTATGGEEQ